MSHPHKERPSEQYFAAEEFPCSDRQIASHTVNYMICLRMDCRIVQRIVSPLDTEESGTLFKRLLPQPLDLQQITTRIICTVLGTILNNILCQSRAYTGHITQKITAGRIQIDPTAFEICFTQCSNWA